MTEKKKKSAEFNIFVLQVTAVAIAVITAVILKFVGGDVYRDIRRWYILNFEDETKISEVIPEKTPPKAEDENTVEEYTGEETQKSETETDAQSLPDAVLPAAIETGNFNVTEKSENALARPLRDYVITSDYGQRENPITYKAERHKGIDLAAEKGTGITAAAAGRVTLVKKSATYGNYIKIDHGDGLETLYAHCDTIIKKEGETVQTGEAIATVGSTGQSTGPHLHFEVILNGTSLNPEWLINW